MLKYKKNKMKKMCLKKNYCCSGEIYKLLDSDVLDNLIKSITNKKIILNNNISIIPEENFLLIIDKYIGYVRDTYNIRHYELLPILKETLKNKYNKCLIRNEYIHNKPSYYLNEFKKMFLKNIYDNTLLYSQIVDENKYKELKYVTEFLKDKNLDNISDLDKIENLFVKVINNRKENIYNCFKLNEKISNEHKEFYFNQLNWLFEDYYLKDI